MSHKLFIFSLIFTLFSCSGNESTRAADQQSNKKKGGSQKAGKTIPVEVKQPTKGLAASYYVTTATIEPSSDAKINSRTSGVVQKLLHEEGDDVKAGEVLLVLDDDDQQLRLKQAEQKLGSAQREFKRLNKMKKSGMVSPTEWETTENTFKTAETDKKLAELALSYTRVAAPFDGRVVWREVDLGAHVGQGELLFRMMSIRPLLVRVHIPANRLGMVAQGQIVELNLDNIAQPLIASIELVSPIVDPTSGTIKITLTIDHYPANVRPGDFTEVHMVTDQHQNALLVSSVSIIEERGKHFLYIVENNKAIRRPVTTGFVMSELTEIVDGIKETDLVVTKGQRTLNDNVSVKVLSTERASVERVPLEKASQEKISADANIKNKRDQS